MDLELELLGRMKAAAGESWRTLASFYTWIKGFDRVFGAARGKGLTIHQWWIRFCVSVHPDKAGKDLKGLADLHFKLIQNIIGKHEKKEAGMCPQPGEETEGSRDESSGVSDKRQHHRRRNSHSSQRSERRKQQERRASKKAKKKDRRRTAAEGRKP